MFGPKIPIWSPKTWQEIVPRSPKRYPDSLCSLVCSPLATPSSSRYHVINMWCNCDVAIINISMVRSLWHVSMWTYQLFAEMLPTNIFPGDWAGQDKTLSFPGDFHTLTFPQHEHRVVPTQNWKTNTKKHKVSSYPVSQCIKMSNSRCRFRC